MASPSHVQAGTLERYEEGAYDACRGVTNGLAAEIWRQHKTFDNNNTTQADRDLLADAYINGYLDVIAARRRTRVPTPA